MDAPAAELDALSALIALASVESRDVATILEERFAAQPSLELLAITFDAFEILPSGLDNRPGRLFLPHSPRLGLKPPAEATASACSTPRIWHSRCSSIASAITRRGPSSWSFFSIRALECRPKHEHLSGLAGARPEYLKKRELNSAMDLPA